MLMRFSSNRTRYTDSNFRDTSDIVGLDNGIIDDIRESPRLTWVFGYKKKG